MILFSPLLVDEQVGSGYDKLALDAGTRTYPPIFLYRN
jgi:hypothetical protein